MSNTLRVQWTITPRTAPQPWLNCSRCRGPRCFRSSGRIRVNANGRRIDAWLVYRCTVCDGTWNRPIVERREVSALDRKLLLSLQANDPDLVRGLAFDAAALKRWTGQVQEFDDVLVTRRVLLECLQPVALLEIECRVPQPIGLRADRLVASELRVSRSSIQRLAKTAQIHTVPPGVRSPPAAARRPAADHRRRVPSREQHRPCSGTERPSAAGVRPRPSRRLPRPAPKGKPVGLGDPDADVRRVARASRPLRARRLARNSLSLASTLVDRTSTDNSPW